MKTRRDKTSFKKHPKIQFGFTSGDRVSRLGGMKGEDVEFLVLPGATSKLPVQKLSTAGARWSAEAVTHFQRLLKAKQEESKGESFSLVVPFSGGGASCFLFLAGNFSTFDLHTEMRAAFGPWIKNSLEAESQIGFRLDVRDLNTGDQEKVLQAFAFLASTLTWNPTAFGKRVEKVLAKSSARQEEIRIHCEVLSTLPSDEAAELAVFANLQAEANNQVRTLAELPANELTPGTYRKHVQEFARNYGLSYEFWDIRELARRKAGSFLAVTRADSKSEGGIACVRYRPRGKGRGKGAKLPVLALVGKGLCFDTGGYNVKTGNYMLGMHGDMTGSAVALALVGLYSQLGVDFEVHAYLALAENLISPTAYKPNEVVVASDGTSIEVVDTDAEGRMVLADTLAQVRKTKPDLVIDFATLTGAAIRSLDTRRCAVFSNQKKLANLAVEAGDRSGERMWTFPIGEDYRKELKSKVADIMQCGPGNNADHIYAATFLSHFIGDETPWVHVDLVAAENKGGLGLISSDTTGFGVLWASEFVQQQLLEE